MAGLDLCHNDEIQISISNWMAGLGFCHNDEKQISISNWMDWYRPLP